MVKMSRATIGTWITVGHPNIAEVMSMCDFNWICVDMEHSVISYAEAQVLIATIQAKDKKAYVRVSDNDPKIINKASDAGADGIIVPMVCNSNDAKKAVDAVKYPPQGKRGVGLARAQGYGFGFEEYKKNKANDIKVIAQIEHIDAVNNIKEIIETDGIDGTFIGPYDLSGSLGKPGQYDDPDVKEAIKKYEEIASNYDKFVGFHVVPADHSLLQEKIDSGYNFIAFSLDTIFLGKKCKEELDKLYKKIGTRDIKEVYSKSNPERLLSSYPTTVLKGDGYGEVSDIIDALAYGKFQRTYNTWGHGQSYYKRRGSIEKEIFANLFSLRNDKKAYALTKSIIPNTVKEFEKRLDELEKQ